MSDKYFIDTNIFIYLIDKNSPKQQVSQNLVQAAIKSGDGYISTQVIQEFLNLATGKFLVQLKSFDSIDFMENILFPLCLVYPDFELYKSAIEIKNETKYSFYDSLIIAAALEADCRVLYSEDLQSGQKIRGLEIVNPYLPGFQLIQ